jgi:hypothetical protein
MIPPAVWKLSLLRVFSVLGVEFRKAFNTEDTEKIFEKN